MLATCLKSTATLGLQPAWFTPSHLFWTEKLLYYAFVDIFHSLAIPLIMARTIPWEHPKGERRRENKFYVRQPEVLESRWPISIHSEMGQVKPAVEGRVEPRVKSSRKKPLFAMKPPILPLPANTVPWIPTRPMEEETLEKFSRLQQDCKIQSYCNPIGSFPKEAFRSAGPRPRTTENGETKILRKEFHHSCHQSTLVKIEC